MSSLRKVLIKKEGQLHLKNGKEVLNDLKRLIKTGKGRTDEIITTNMVLIKKIQSMRAMENNLPKSEY